LFSGTPTPEISEVPISKNHKTNGLGNDGPPLESSLQQSRRLVRHLRPVKKYMEELKNIPGQGSGAGEGKMPLFFFHALVKKKQKRGKPSRRPAMWGKGKREPLGKRHTMRGFLLQSRAKTCQQKASRELGRPKGELPKNGWGGGLNHKVFPLKEFFGKKGHRFTTPGHKK